jgi:hypothetical protein
VPASRGVARQADDSMAHAALRPYVRKNARPNAGPRSRDDAALPRDYRDWARPVNHLVGLGAGTPVPGIVSRCQPIVPESRFDNSKTCSER